MISVLVVTSRASKGRVIPSPAPNAGSGFQMKTPSWPLWFRLFLPHYRGKHGRLQELLKILVVCLEYDHQLICIAIHSGTVTRSFLRGAGVHFLKEDAGLQNGRKG